MKRANLVRLLAGVLLSGVLLAVGSAEQSSVSSQVRPPSTDPLLGAWLLNIKESTNPSAASEIITIVKEENGFRFDFVERNDNGYNPHSSIVTTMRGETSRILYSDGKQDQCNWRVRRQGAKNFEMELVCPHGGWKDKYEVSTSGRKLTFHRIWSNAGIIAEKIDPNGVIRSVPHIHVFDKISVDEARSSIQTMDDQDAAEKAVASQKAAEQAALDATACTLASGQTAVLTTNPSAWLEYVCPKDGFAITIPNPPQKQSLARFNFYKLFMTGDESIVAQLWVSSEPVNCTDRLAKQRNLANEKLPLKTVRGTVETTFQGQPAFETVDTHTNGPKYLLYDLDQCLGDKNYRFHARWLAGQTKPEEVSRIFSSFRLVSGEIPDR